MMKRLYDNATSVKFKDHWIVDDGGHEDTFVKAGKDYYINVSKFFNRCLGEESFFSTMKAKYGKQYELRKN